MEVIRKKICLESSRTRKQGLLPFIRFNEYDKTISAGTRQCRFVSEDDENGNWGGFVINPFEIENLQMVYKDYAYLTKMYNEMMKIIDTGIKLKKVLKLKNDGSGDLETCYTLYLDDEYDEYDYYPVNRSWFSTSNDILFRQITGMTIPDEVEVVIMFEDDLFQKFRKYENDYAYDGSYKKCKKMDEYTGKLHVPKDIIGEKVPSFINYCDVNSMLAWMVDNKNSNDCCTKKLWEDRGGEAMLNYLSEKSDEYPTVLENMSKKLIINENIGQVDDRCIPKINIELMLTQNFEPEGLGVPYLDEDTPIFSGLPYSYAKDITDYVAESELSKLMDDEKFYDDNDDELPGIFQRFRKEVTSDGSVYESALFKYNSQQKLWLEVTNDFNYGNDYLVSDLVATIPENADKSATYLVRYNNTSECPMRIPYSVNSPKNITVLSTTGTSATCIADVILDIDTTSVSGKIYFKYVLGGKIIMVLNKDTNNYVFNKYIENTGIVYRDEYNFTKSKVGTFEIDGVEAEIYYDEIDYNSAYSTVYSKEFGMYRNAILSNIIAMPKHDGLTSGNTIGDFGAFTNTPMFMPDYMLGITSDISASAAFEVSRGNAAAFERHFKLSECNTLEDLENYGNNFFNL